LSPGDRNAIPTTSDSPYRREISMLEKIQRRTVTMLTVLRVKVLDRGAPPVVYGLLVDLIAVVIVVIVATLATQFQGGFPGAADILP
jgi:Flp pilus assembly pilin Flp